MSTELGIPDLTSLFDLTVEEIAAIEAALFSYQMETERYLHLYPKTFREHDACCKTAKALEADRAIERASLVARLDTIKALQQRLPEIVQ